MDALGDQKGIVGVPGRIRQSSGIAAQSLGNMYLTYKGRFSNPRGDNDVIKNPSQFKKVN